MNGLATARCVCPNPSRALRGTLLAAAFLAALAGAAAGADGVYVVRGGDTLWQIARDLSGDAARWPELYRANRDQIKDPSRLYPGQRLAIPDFDAPEAARSAAREGAATEASRESAPGSP